MRILTSTLLLLPTLATAQDVDGAAQSRKVKYAERTEIEFDTTDVTATTVKPRGIVVTEVTGLVFEPMIELRSDFDTEMRESLLQVR